MAIVKASSTTEDGRLLLVMAASIKDALYKILLPFMLLLTP